MASRVDKHLMKDLPPDTRDYLDILDTDISTGARWDVHLPAVDWRGSSKMNDSVLPAAGAYSRTKVLTEMIEALIKGYFFS